MTFKVAIREDERFLVKEIGKGMCIILSDLTKPEASKFWYLQAQRYNSVGHWNHREGRMSRNFVLNKHERKTPTKKEREIAKKIWTKLQDGLIEKQI